MSRTVVIDFSPERAPLHAGRDAIVAVDVIRATTTAVTGMVAGRSCHPVPTLEGALSLAARLDRPLLVGEVGGRRPPGFDLTNSPHALAQRADVERPMILLSSSGTRLIAAARSAEVYVACLRNWSAQAAAIADRHDDVAVLGAGTRGEFREEDQLCCAWIASALVDAGYAPLDAPTRRLIARWRGAPLDALLVSRSVAHLRETGQEHDLDFVMTHVGDVDGTFGMDGDRIVAAGAGDGFARTLASVAAAG